MTVIATRITAHYTAHASDSFITEVQADGSLRIVEEQQTKIVSVPKWRGAMSYWGFARQQPDWSTLDWLRERARQADRFGSAEDFARDVALRLGEALNKRFFRNATDKGIGIHFTAYERVGDYYVPELFHIRNWDDTSYATISGSGLMVTRESFGTLKRRIEREVNDRNHDRRMAVHNALHQDKAMFIYNNGDPVLFNPIANAVLGSFQQLMLRGQLRDPADVHTHLSLVRRPIEVVSHLQTDLVKVGYRRVGGKRHDLAIAPMER